MAHWHDENPWADDVVYVSIEDLAACVAGGSLRISGEVIPYTAERVIDHWRQGGDKLDAYLLQSPEGIQAGVRHGAEPGDYFSPMLQDVDRAQDLVAAARASEPVAPAL